MNTTLFFCLIPNIVLISLFLRITDAQLCFISPNFYIKPEIAFGRQPSQPTRNLSETGQKLLRGMPSKLTKDRLS